MNGKADRDPVEELLEHARPRPAPPRGDVGRVREAVHAHWRRQVRNRRLRHVSFAAMAASLVAAVMLALTLSRTNEMAPTDVARVEKQFGAVYLVREDEGFVELGDAQRLLTGQVVQTAQAAGLGLLIGEVSVRLDEESRIELQASDRIYLQRGRLYVNAPQEEPSSSLVIRTDQGAVAHLGTQYMVAIAGDELTVSVREGGIRIDGRYYDARATAGEQVTLRGTWRPALQRIAAASGSWRWTEALAHRLEVDGLPAERFLSWVRDETGYGVVFTDDRARAIAANTLLKGVVNEDPRTALKLRLLTMDLGYEIDDARGEIRIRSTAR